LDYRAIVERHLRKHTGLRHAAKACPVDLLAMETGNEPAADVRTNQASGPKRPAPENRAGSANGSQSRQQGREAGR
jgi:hypothetical protein